LDGGTITVNSIVFIVVMLELVVVVVKNFFTIVTVNDITFCFHTDGYVFAKVKRFLLL
jgi:hypothetical protein